MSTNHRVPLNTMFNFSGLLCQMAVSFFMAPFLVHRLGDAAYGVWAIILSIFGYMGLLELGVTTSLVRYVARYDVKETRHTMGILLSSALLFYLVVGCLAAAITVLIGAFGMGVFNVPADVLGKAGLTMALMGLSLLVRFPGYVFTSFLAGMRLYYKRNVVEIGALLVRSGFIVLAIRAGKGLVGLAAVTVVFDSVQYFTIFLVAKRQLRGVKIHVRDATRQCLREVLSYGVKVFGTVSLRTMSYGIDPVVIGIVLSSRWVTFFNVPFLVIRYLKSMLLALTAALMPVFSNLQAQDQMSQVRTRFLRYSRYLAAMALFPAMGVLTLGEPFLRLWMGPDYASRGAYVLMFLSLSFIFYALAPCSIRLLMGTGNQHILLAAAAVHAPVRLGLSIVLLHSFGIVGVALADFITEGGLQFYLLVRTSRYLNIRMRDYARCALLGPITVTLFVGLFLSRMSGLAYPQTWTQLMTQGTLATILWLVLTFLIVIPPNDKKLIFRFVKRIRSAPEAKECRHPAETHAGTDGTISS